MVPKLTNLNLSWKSFIKFFFFFFFNLNNQNYSKVLRHFWFSQKPSNYPIKLGLKSLILPKKVYNFGKIRTQKWGSFFIWSPKDRYKNRWGDLRLYCRYLQITKMIDRGIFRTLPNIWDGVFYINNLRLKVVNCFRKLSILPLWQITEFHI